MLKFFSVAPARVYATVAWLLLCFTALASAGIAQMASPSIDHGRPFSYFSKSTDEIGLMNAPSATEISPEGYLYTGFGELMFFLGPEQTPLSARVRTLEDGDLPIVSYAVSHLGIDYRFTAFTAQVPQAQTSDSAPTMEIVNLVRVTLTNSGRTPRAAFLTTAMRYQSEQTTGELIGDNRFRRPIEPDKVGEHAQPGEAFREDWKYSLADGACLREDRALFLYPQQPAPRLALTLHSHYNRVEPLTSAKLKLSPATPACSVSYVVALKQWESRTIDLKMPLLPPHTGSPEFAHLLAAGFDAKHAEVVQFWKTLLARGMRIELPEQKPVDTFYASLVYDLLARNIVDGQFVQTVNQFQYHRFYLRDSADFVRMYDATGYSDIGAQVLSFFATRQQPDGNFLSQPQQYDGWGEAMWAYGEHYRRTGDLAFARDIYPHLVRAVDWLIAARAKDPLHVMPASDVRDNEYVSGHLTGYNFLALDGLQSAIVLAKALGHDEDAARFQHESDDYRATFLALLDKASRSQGGILPPSLDATGSWKGTDWGNLLSITPEPQLDPFDPRVTATLRSTQARYQEGIMTYAEPDDGAFLHHYLTIKNTLTELVRGEQQQAIREFYAELLHTSSTHAGFEYAIRPWGSRDFEGNIAPHGWFSADYRNLLRNMLVREDGDTLHLFSAISPEWVGPGKAIRVTGAPTCFGKLDFSLTSMGTTSAVLHIEAQWKPQPHAVVVHLPWFLDGVSATADGKPVKVLSGAIQLPASSSKVRIHWRSRANVRMSYARTVDSYEQEYQRRYDHLLTTGAMQSGPDSWHVPE